MPLNARIASVRLAVVAFFIVATVGSVSGLCSWTCTKRAVIAFVLTYVFTRFATKAVNSIAIRAMISDTVKRQEEEDKRE